MQVLPNEKSYSEIWIVDTYLNIQLNMQELLMKEGLEGDPASVPIVFYYFALLL